MANYVMYDTTNANELAKFQGTLAGIQAGNATLTGTGTAATTIYNQAGWYAMQDTETGNISLQKLANDSMYTKQWYDQTTGTIFDFSDGGSGVTSAHDSTSSSSSSSNSNSALEEYMYGPGYTVTDSSNTSNSSSSVASTNDYVTDEDGNIIELTAQDLQDLVDEGIYDNMADALNATLSAGYYVSDDEQAAMGLYSDEDESKIQTMMEKYGLSREDAVASLQGAITDPEVLSDSTELKEQLGEVQDNQGFIGKAWNSIKNFFGAGVSSDDCEYAIEQFEAGEISYEEASALIDEYESKQSSVTSAVKTGAAVAAGIGVGLLTGGGGLVATIGLGAAAGAATKTSIGIADRATNNNDEDDGFNKEVVTDAATGALAGAAGAVGARTVSKGVGKAKSIASTVKSKAAEKAAEKAAGKTAGKITGSTVKKAGTLALGAGTVVPMLTDGT